MRPHIFDSGLALFSARGSCNPIHPLSRALKLLPVWGTVAAQDIELKEMAACSCPTANVPMFSYVSPEPMHARTSICLILPFLLS